MRRRVATGVGGVLALWLVASVVHAQVGERVRLDGLGGLLVDKTEVTIGSFSASWRKQARSPKPSGTVAVLSMWVGGSAAAVGRGGNPKARHRHPICPPCT